MQNTTRRIFISSSIYDLLDVRAEVETELRKAGLITVMSDSKNDGFDSTIQTNSIETCLINLKNCEIAIFILSQRYGPTLSNIGFPEHSATHLEYLKAIEYGMPIYFYARDRLMGEYSVWKKNKGDQGLKFTWVDARNIRIFQFISERDTLTDLSNNWITTFSSSVDLKAQILRDLKIWIDESTFWLDVDNGSIPILYPDSKCINKDETTQVFELVITNCGLTSAINLDIAYDHGQETHRLLHIPPNQKYVQRSVFNPRIAISRNRHITVKYYDTKGRQYIDEFETSIQTNGNTVISGVKQISRKFIDTTGRERKRDA